VWRELQDDMLEWAGRIAANNFSRFNVGQEGCSAAETDSEQHQQVGRQQQIAASPAQGSSQQSSAVEAAAAPLPPQQQQQQQLAQHGVQSQLQRLQLAQRSLWECDDVSCQTHDATPGDAHGSRLPEPGPDPSASSEATPSSDQSCISSGVSEQPAAWHTESHAGQAPADQPQSTSPTAAEAPKPEPADVVDGTVAQPCGIASAGASVTAHAQPIGRELFITASYFNHS
jgi:hypothetical protein